MKKKTPRTYRTSLKLGIKQDVTTTNRINPTHYASASQLNTKKNTVSISKKK